MATSPLQKAAADLARRMSEMGVDHAIAGALTARGVWLAARHPEDDY